jgi:uncharacterized membrane protein HdeD (DUF308 family)
MLVVGLVLLGYLLGFSTPRQVPALFLVGVGAIFCIQAILKARAPVKYEMSARTTLAYGVLALVIGVLWFSLSLQTVIAEYLLVLILIFFGFVFLAYTRLR